ncbi:hypothetical protein F4825DRAFT_451144 [Nemania diffusa]|nr:hypothetical protein F4825DRAFT_451144 [Nemania diffusa]
MVAATGGALTHDHEVEPSIEVIYSVLKESPLLRELVLHRVVTPDVMGRKDGPKGLLDEVADLTRGPAEREAPALRIPRPTATPSLRNRQDDGQIQALSAQLQSATEAISSVSQSASLVLSQMSQSAQSVRQSADQATQSIQQSANQAVQSANQVADQATRQLSQTQSSASSAVSAANARASDQISQSLASMSSRISANSASAQSSVSAAISSARAAASQFAASQIQSFKAAGASSVGGDTATPTEQPQSNSVSASTLAIIVTVSVVGTAIITAISSFFFLRYRRKKRSSRIRAPATNEKTYEKPIAVRGSLSPPSPRFGKGPRSRISDFRLPSFSPLMKSKKAQGEEEENIGFAASEYSDREEDIVVKRVKNDVDKKLSDPEGTQPSIFRLQKTNGISSATTVRLIRVGSENRKSSSTDAQQIAAEPIPPPPVVTAPSQNPKSIPITIPYQPPIQSPLQTNTPITQPPKAKEPSPEEQRVSLRSTRSFDMEAPSGRPLARLTATSQNRFKFRDSSDMESNASTPINRDTMPPLSNSNRPSLSMSRPLNILQGQTGGRGGYLSGTSSGRPKNGAGTFATFPRPRKEPPRDSMMNRGRPNINNLGPTLRREEERRRRELAELVG